MTDEQLREAVARAMCDAVNVEGTYEETGTLHREKVWLTSADAAIALMRPVIRAEALEEAALELERWGDIYGDNAARVKELEKALARQCDNMAFIVNHVTMPEKWLHKWERELAEDRVALTTNTERTA